MKTTITITNNFEVDFTINPKAEYVRRTGDYHMEAADADDWDWDFHDIVCLETGCPVDENVFGTEEKNQLIAYYHDNYEPPCD